MSTPAPATIPAAALQADAALLRQAYEGLHPGLYRYRSKAAVDGAFGALEREFGQPRTLAEAYLAIARLTSYIQCGHSYPNFFNQAEPVTQALLRRPRVPFEFRWLDGGRMVVTRSYVADPQLGRGAEILTIDGRPVAEILAALLPYSRADGANDARRISNLEVQGRAEYEAFDVYFPLVFPRDESRPLRLTVRSAPGKPVTAVEVMAMPPAGRISAPGAPAGSANPWTYSEAAPGVGLLRMPTWAMYKSKFGWEAYLDELFAQLDARRTPDLVIDLRGNEGGSNVGDRLLAHLIERESSAPPIERRTRYRRVPEPLRPHLDTWDRTFYDWGAAATDLGDGYFRLTRYGDEGAAVKPVPPRYAGRVWVLVGATNSSATFEFASAVRRGGFGKLVGQPTGGNQRGITGGGFFFLRLPQSGIEVDVPLIGQFPVSAVLPPDAGLEPDIHVRPALEDIAVGRDAEIAAVLAQIAASRR